MILHWRCDLLSPSVNRSGGEERVRVRCARLRWHGGGMHEGREGQFYVRWKQRPKAPFANESPKVRR